MFVKFLFAVSAKKKECNIGTYLSASIGKEGERESLGIKRKQECLCLWIAEIGASKIHKIGRKVS